MSSHKNPLASVIIVNKDGKQDLIECISSVENQTLEEREVLLVDNSSSDGSVDFVRSDHPDVRVIQNSCNRWYAGGNNDGFEEANGKYLIILNPDVAVEPDWLEKLIQPLEEDGYSKTGLSTSKILQYDCRDTINTCGNEAHFTGLGFTRGFGEVSSEFMEQESVPAVSGCSFAMSQSVYEQIGGFDESFEFYYEDLDLSWRARLAGYDIVCNPESVVYHKYERPMPSWRYFNMERNRWLILLKHLEFTSLIKLLPALLLTEILILGYATVLGGGHIQNVIKAWKWIYINRELVLAKRNEIQDLRTIKDEELFRELSFKIPLQRFGISSTIAQAMNALLAIIYWPTYWFVQK